MCCNNISKHLAPNNAFFNEWRIVFMKQICKYILKPRDMWGWHSGLR